jgi:hypothetical protein
MNALYGIEKFLQDLFDLGYLSEKVIGSDNVKYAVIRNYEVPIGKFQGRIIDLGIPIPDDYPRLIGPSIHIRATPQLLEYADTIPNVRNIIGSQLGQDWRYWSFRLNILPENTTANILFQIHGIFQRI